MRPFVAPVDKESSNIKGNASDNEQNKTDNGFGNPMLTQEAFVQSMVKELIPLPIHDNPPREMVPLLHEESHVWDTEVNVLTDNAFWEYLNDKYV